MSGMHDGAPDPLAALRSSDRRPKSEVLRERLRTDGPALIAATGGRLAIAVLVTVLAIGVGWRLFVESEPPVEASLPFATAPANDVGDSTPPVSADATPIAPTLNVDATIVDESTGVVIVHVAGAVARPGLIRGTAEWRIDDAVREAGGPVASADLDRVNLAAPIVDGQRIFVPRVDEPVPAVIEPDSAANESGQSGGVVDLNASDVTELQTLPGVGPATAAAIVSHREDFGSFGTVDALVAVPGIGPATLEALREHVRV